jgi:hypothetical protein
LVPGYHNWLVQEAGGISGDRRVRLRVGREVEVEGVRLVGRVHDGQVDGGTDVEGVEKFAIETVRMVREVLER